MMNRVIHLFPGALDRALCQNSADPDLNQKGMKSCNSPTSWRVSQKRFLCR